MSQTQITWADASSSNNSYEIYRSAVRSLSSPSSPHSSAPSNLAAIHDGMSGSGTSSDPYIVTTDYELQSMSEDLSASYRLGNDIDASGTATWQNNTGFDPIGKKFVGNNPKSFTGTIDGDGHIVQGLTLNRAALSTAGLVAQTGSGALIENLRLQNIDYTLQNEAGPFVGKFVSGATIQNCSASGVVSGEQFVGGVAGNNFGGTTVENVVTTVDVTSRTDQAAGGVTGQTTQFNGVCTLDNVIAAGKITSTESGGLIGTLGGSVDTNAAYWDTEATGKSTSPVGIAKTTSELQGESVPSGLDTTFVWETAPNSYPLLRSQLPAFPSEYILLDTIAPDATSFVDETAPDGVSSYVVQAQPSGDIVSRQIPSSSSFVFSVSTDTSSSSSATTVVNIPVTTPTDLGVTTFAPLVQRQVNGSLVQEFSTTNSQTSRVSEPQLTASDFDTAVIAANTLGAGELLSSAEDTSTTVFDAAQIRELTPTDFDETDITSASVQRTRSVSLRSNDISTVVTQPLLLSQIQTGLIADTGLFDSSIQTDRSLSLSLVDLSLVSSDPFVDRDVGTGSTTTTVTTTEQVTTTTSTETRVGQSRVGSRISSDAVTTTETITTEEEVTNDVSGLQDISVAQTVAQRVHNPSLSVDEADLILIRPLRDRDALFIVSDSDSLSTVTAVSRSLTNTQIDTSFTSTTTARLRTPRALSLDLSETNSSLDRQRSPALQSVDEDSLDVSPLVTRLISIGLISDVSSSVTAFSRERTLSKSVSSVDNIGIELDTQGVVSLITVDDSVTELGVTQFREVTDFTVSDPSQIRDTTTDRDVIPQFTVVDDKFLTINLDRKGALIVFQLDGEFDTQIELDAEAFKIKDDSN